MLYTKVKVFLPQLSHLSNTCASLLWYDWVNSLFEYILETANYIPIKKFAMPCVVGSVSISIKRKQLHVGYFGTISIYSVLTCAYPSCCKPSPLAFDIGRYPFSVSQLVLKLLTNKGTNYLTSYAYWKGLKSAMVLG